jgi:signal transduction histidine kinase
MVMSRVWIERASVALAALAIAVGVLTPVVATMDPGVQLFVNHDASRIEVAWVEPYSPAERWGVQPGMIVTSVNGQVVLRVPEAIYPEPGPDTTPDPETGEIPQPPAVIEPTVATPITTDASVLEAIASQPVRSLEAVSAAELATYDPMLGFPAVSFYDDGRNSLQESLLSVVFGIGILFGTAWLLTTGRAGRGLEDVGLPLALATSSPFLLAPLTSLWHPVATAAFAILLPLTMLPLAAALLGRIGGDQERRVVLAAVVVCAAGAVVAGLARELNPIMGAGSWPPGLSWAPTLLTAGLTVVPGVVAAGPAIPGGGAGPAIPGAEPMASGRVLRSAELAIVGVTPAVALLVAGSAVGWAFLIWVAAIGAAGRFTVRPLARLASRAQLQRDLVVAATEAERARVAADIHDDALQELTLLVRRLDAAGDTEGADIARTVSDKLRAICGDLRLPILDDLGVGPALDWLVLRIERLAGGEVRLERADGTRPPPDVELAFFRIAQEALANAVKHGRPPIVVRYRSVDGAASLSIDDSGSGIPPDAGDRAEREGHFGLLNMQQRAEGIGAILDVRRWPQGGTHVQLEWRAR